MPIVALATVVWAALLESCGIVIQLKPALVVLAHLKLRALDASNQQRSPAAPALTAVLRVRVLGIVILVLGCGRRWVRQRPRRPVGLECRLDVAEPFADHGSMACPGGGQF